MVESALEGVGWEVLEQILPRYDKPLPRYTSYPTAPVWSEDYDTRSFVRDLQDPDREPGAPRALYVHVPFCREICHFCACNRVITRDADLVERYLSTIEREIDAIHKALVGEQAVGQIHWGGGTPTHLSPEQIHRLFGMLTNAFPVAEEAEISIEVDPRVTTPEHVDTLRECGFNRLSLGVQDFDPRVQKAIHRIQSPEMTADLVNRARASGFSSIGLDLIYGLPYQTPESFARTLDDVIAISPDRIALYAYAHVPWVAKQQRGFERGDLPEPSTRVQIMLLGIRRLLDCGYEFIGLDHFAKPEDGLAKALRSGTLRRSFMGHTTQDGVELIGFGPSAISELGSAYAQSHRDLPSWSEAVAEGGVATMRGHRLSAEDAERRWVIFRVISCSELRADEYRAVFGKEFADVYAAEISSLAEQESDGLVEIGSDGSVKVLPLG
ncbi:MAG: oxygen-independent coproporphyrinogen III oxidase, partial [bacterium]|nr:oxygen-independent coproporphyrinogen III oxidase [bacterium]